MEKIRRLVRTYIYNFLNSRLKLEKFSAKDLKTQVMLLLNQMLKLHIFSPKISNLKQL